ncbi:MAG TPA: hypothetical protein VF680_16735 [Allosphingosinicella sp.]|jgi:hypothetical protein
MACKRQTKTNSADSILFNTIYENLADQNELKADELYSYFHSEDFIEQFGNYIQDRTNETILDRVDENGEPKLDYDGIAKKYYFVDKTGEKIFYPLIKRGLRSLFDYKQIEAITSQLALSYFKTNTNYDFNNIDFETGQELPNLTEFLKQKIKSKVDELSQTGDDKDLFNSMDLEESLEHIEEWKDNVDVFFKKIGLKRNDNVEDESSESIEEIEEDSKDPAFNKASFERDTKDSISTNMKLRLSLLTDNNTKDTIWNEPQFVKFDDIYSTLLTVLSDQVTIGNEDIFEIYKQELVRVASKKPFFDQLVSFVNEPSFSENEKNEFTQAFRLHKNNFLVTELKNDFVESYDENYQIIKSEVFNHVVKTVSNSGNRSSRLMSDWGNNFKALYQNQDGSFKKDISEKITIIQSQLDELNKSFNNKSTTQDFESAVNEYVQILNKLGVETTELGFTHYLDSDGRNIFNHQQQIVRLSSAIVNTLDAVKKIKTWSKREVNEDRLDDKDNNANIFISTRQNIFKQIANSEAFFLGEGSDASIHSGGKTKWLYSYPSYLSTKILQWKKDRNTLLDLYNKSAYNQGSHLMKWLLAKELSRIDEETVSKERINSFEMGIFSNLQEVGGESKAGSEISFNDYFLDHVNKVLTNGYVRTTTPADKSTDIQLKTGFFENSFSGFSNNQIQLTESTQKIFFEYFNSEFNRMKEAYKEIQAYRNNPSKLTIHYHFKKGSFLYNEDGSINPKALGNAFKSQYFPNLSFDSKTTNPLAIQIKSLLYTNSIPNEFAGADLRNNPKGELDDKAVGIKTLIQQYINIELSNGIIETGATFRAQGIYDIAEDGKTINKLINTETFNKYVTNKPLAAASDFYINSLIQNIEYSKMFTGDVAFYKDMIDYKKRVPATYTDGLQLRLKPGEETFNVATISSVEIPSPFMNELREMIGDGANAYSNINSADAQAWITPKRWKFLVERLGKWTPVHNTLYSKMISDVAEQYTEEELKIAAQPLKGVYFDINGKTPSYLKYSQAVLTKNLVKGTDLQRMYDKMVAQDIDEVITLDGFKVGSSTPTTIHNEDGTIKDDFDFNIIPLFNSGWKLQQDLPTKTFKETEVGSQIQKNIFGGLKFNRDATFILDGQDVTGQNIIDEITQVTKSLSDMGMDSLKKEFNIDNNGKIKNVRGFYNSLISELEKRGGSKNVIDALKKEITLYGVPQAGTKIINVFSSIMNKRLVKIKTNGGSFIQMSNFGLNKQEGDNRGVLWSPDAFDTTNEPTRYVDENGKVRIRPGGILLSGSFIAKYIPNYRDYTSEQLFNEIIDKRITENLIGYRIPNQGLASNDALRVVGILPEENGDTVVAYTGITTKTGSDFDIDKMYLMFPSFTLQRTQEFKDGKLVYITGNSKEGLQNRLIELYQSVLTHPEVIKDVMKPIDIDFIKNYINHLLPSETKGTLGHFNSYNDIKLLYDFRGGKAGVGQEANAVVDINRLGQLSLNQTYIDWGHMNDRSETIFDEEYSVPLSKADIEYFVEDMEKFYKSQGMKFDKQGLIEEVSKVRIGDSLTAILNAFVDIAKDPYITRGNWVTSTTNTGNLMLRAGMHPLYVTAFMAQPVIRDYIDYQTSKESIIGNNSGNMKFKFKQDIVMDNLKDKVIEYTTDKGIVTRPLALIYKSLIRTEKVDPSTKLDEQTVAKNLGLKNPTDEDLIKINKAINTIIKEHDTTFKLQNFNWSRVTLKDFRDQIKDKKDGPFQMAVFNKFQELQEYSKAMRENINVSKSDTSGMGKNISTVYATANQKQYILDKEVGAEMGVLNGFGSKFDNTVLSAYYNNVINETIKLITANADLFPQGTHQVQNMFNEVSQDLYGTPAFDTKLMTILEREYYSYAMANFFDISSEESIDLITKLPNEFQAFRKANRHKYLILDELEIKQGDSRIKKFISLNNRKKSPDFEDRFTDSWRDLRIDNPELANKLIRYSFLTSGFKINSNQFFTYIPNEYFVENNINRFIKSFVNTNQQDFLDKFYLNNYTDKKFVPNVFPTQSISLENTKLENGKTSSNFRSGFIMNEPGKARYYTTHFSNKMIYKLEGYDSEGRGVYTRVNPYGYKAGTNYISEYGNQYTDKLFEGRGKLDVIPEHVQQLKNMVETYRRYSEPFELSLEDNSTNDVVENLWNEYKDNILSVNPDTTLETLKQMEEEFGTKETIEFIKKCKG